MRRIYVQGVKDEEHRQEIFKAIKSRYSLAKNEQEADLIVVANNLFGGDYFLRWKRANKKICGIPYFITHLDTLAADDSIFPVCQKFQKHYFKTSSWSTPCCFIPFNFLFV